MFCTNCGKVLRMTDHFCSNCGQKVVRTQEVKEESKYQILAERDSVSMGDDVMAPNRQYLEYQPQERLSEFLDTIADYVPNIRNSVWSIVCKRREIAYLIFDDSPKYHYKLNIPDILVSMLPKKEIYCEKWTSGELVERFIKKT